MLMCQGEESGQNGKNKVRNYTSSTIMKYTKYEFIIKTNFISTWLNFPHKDFTIEIHKKVLQNLPESMDNTSIFSKNM